MKAQEDVAGGQKRAGEEEDPYNEENVEQVGPTQKQTQVARVVQVLPHLLGGSAHAPPPPNSQQQL